MLIRTAAKAALRTLGFGIYRIPRANEQINEVFTYSANYPNATLAPWLADRAFMEAFEKVKSHTLVDIYRLHELWTLVEQTRNIGGDIVEVGVWRGGSGALMAHRDQLLGGKATVYLCDTFAGVVRAGDRDSSYKGGEHRDTDVSYVERLQQHFALENTKVLVGIFPDDTASHLDADRVRLVHVDVDVYRSAKQTVETLWDRMPSGAVIVFDDYGFIGCEGITRLVDELRGRDDVFYVHNLNGHALLYKR